MSYVNGELQADKSVIVQVMFHGYDNRYESLKKQGGKVTYFQSNAEIMSAIHAWYPIAYRILEDMLPQFVEHPNEMPICVRILANSYINHLFLKEDRDVLRFF